MFIHTETGVKFKNRKEAITLMGEKRFKKFLSLNEFTFEQYKDNN